MYGAENIFNGIIVLRFVDCGVPGSPIDGTRFLVNGSTTLSSVVQYSCNENFRLVGPRGRVCNTDGSWSNTEPVCERNNLNA